MHEKLNIQTFNPLKSQFGTENLVNDNDAKEKKNQTFEREVELVHSVSPFTKNLNKNKSVMSRLRYFSIINIPSSTNKLRHMEHCDARESLIQCRWRSQA